MHPTRAGPRSVMNNQISTVPESKFIMRPPRRPEMNMLETQKVRTKTRGRDSSSTMHDGYDGPLGAPARYAD